MRILLAVSLALVGCGANVVFGEDGDGSTPGDDLRAECQEFCDQQDACPTADPSCESSCEQIDALTPASCTDELETYLGCFNRLPDPCAPGESCFSEAQVVATCFTTACAEEPDDPACPDF